MRRMARWITVSAAVLWLLVSALGNWFVHHRADWLSDKLDRWPRVVTTPLVYFGDRSADFTDAIGLTGHDAVYSFDEAAPTGSVLFAGIPMRRADPAPKDIKVIDRGDFIIGWSPSLRHPAWVAYHVPQNARFDINTRPSTFKKDATAPSSPASAAYSGCGYDRGHMAPNHAIATRFGEEAQKLTFLMSNISPQTPALNRGPWRNLELRIADYWAKKYGEIWVIVGAVSGETMTRECIPGTDIDVPVGFYQIIVAQNKDGVRAMALYMPQTIRSDAFPSRYIVSISELEDLTGFDFLPDLPKFLSKPLEAEAPTRLWPVGVLDAFKLIIERFRTF